MFTAKQDLKRRPDHCLALNAPTRNLLPSGRDLAFPHGRWAHSPWKAGRRVSVRATSHTHEHTLLFNRVTRLLLHPPNQQQFVIWINSDCQLVKQKVPCPDQGRLDDLSAYINIWMESSKYVVFPSISH